MTIYCSRYKNQTIDHRSDAFIEVDCLTNWGLLGEVTVGCHDVGTTETVLSGEYICESKWSEKSVDKSS